MSILKNFAVPPQDSMTGSLYLNDVLLENKIGLESSKTPGPNFLMQPVFDSDGSSNILISWSFIS
jgi:hypothetical protein